MSEKKHEALSALVDGELPAEDGPRLLDEVLEDGMLKRRWSTYHLIGDVMRKHVIDKQALEGDGAAPPDSRVVPLRRRGMHPLAGLALAASVALLAVIGIFAVSEPDKAPLEIAGKTVSVEIPSSSDSGPIPVVAGSVGLDLTRMTWNDAGPEVTTRLNGYLVTHNEYLANGMRGMLPYARIVAYDGGQK